jgi:hypothetical protein
MVAGHRVAGDIMNDGSLGARAALRRSTLASTVVQNMRRAVVITELWAGWSCGTLLHSDSLGTPKLTHLNTTSTA